MTFHPRARGRGLSRRQFLQRSAGAAIALPSLSAILAACGRDGDGPTGDGDSVVRIGSPDDPVDQPIFDDIPAIDSDLEPEAGPLQIYNWADYLRPRTLREFSEEFGVEVELTTFYNEEEALRKLRTGELQMDVYFPTSEVVSKIVAGRILQPLNHDYLPNLRSNVWPFLADPFYDQGSRYTVPYTVYQTGIGWRTDMVDSADIEDVENPWDVFWNPKYKDITGLYDDFEEALSLSLFRLGHPDPWPATEEEVSQAAEELIKLVDLVNVRYTIDGAYSGVPQGKFGLHQAWSGDMVATPYYFPKGDDPEVARYLWPPKSSAATVAGLIANDCLGIPANAEHPVLGHMFLNYMLNEQHALNNFGWVGYQPPQNGLDPDSLVADGWVAEWLSSTIVRPEDFEAERGVIPLQLPPEREVYWVDAWSRVQQGG
jgi:spermidine/putrescine transport system substrate-binding protein